ncbi:hypothetical protein D9758_004367 [Tetrapyrgos nigripes]|uniref:Uncharacterized protein n=1 Tax=Tetrapyrgos nigripes TaxID=182062 RepID=A0A8H5GMZ7_9AGAR|nr:hypothetical protein D9758_004367 [Tetrapyrgos nigripes]
MRRVSGIKPVDLHFWSFKSPLSSFLLSHDTSGHKVTIFQSSTLTTTTAFAMYKTTTSLLTLSMIALSVSGAAVDRALRGLLISRQDAGGLIDPSIIPSQCESACSDIVSTVNSCDPSDLTCGCSTQDIQEFTNCMQCFAQLDSSLESVAEQNIDNLRNICAAAGSADIPSGTASATGIFGGGSVGLSASAPGASVTRTSAGSGSGGFTISSDDASQPIQTSSSPPRTTGTSSSSSGDDGSDDSDDSDSSDSSSSGDGLAAGQNGALTSGKANAFLSVVAGVVFGVFMVL